MPLVLLFNRPLKFGQKLVEVVFSCFFFIWWFWNTKRITYMILWSNLLFLMLIGSIFFFFLVNFYQEECTVTLIQRKRRSKNRLGAETIAALLLTRCSCSRCECTHLLTCTPKKIRAAHAPLTVRCETGCPLLSWLAQSHVGGRS